jgi:hypothetical protein
MKAQASRLPPLSDAATASLADGTAPYAQDPRAHLSILKFLGFLSATR